MKLLAYYSLVLWMATAQGSNPDLLASTATTDLCILQILLTQKLKSPPSSNAIIQKIANVQQRELQRFDSEIQQKLAASPSPYHSLPKGLRPDLAQVYQSVWFHLKNPRSVFIELQNIEKLVCFSGHLHAQGIARPNHPLERAYRTHLSLGEENAGFRNPVVVQRFLANSEFLGFVSAGHPVIDETYRGKPHTRDGHRLLHLALSRLIDRQWGAGTYGNLYRDMGDETRLHLLDWNGTGIDTSLPRQEGDPRFLDLHGYMVDSPFFSVTHAQRPTDLTNPEFFAKTFREYLPILAQVWE